MKLSKILFISFAIVFLAASCSPRYIFYPPYFTDEDDSTPYDVSTVEDFSAMLESSGQARLISNITLADNIDFGERENLSIDLNGNSLSIEKATSFIIPEGKSLEISGGSLKTSLPEGSNSASSCIVVADNATLTLDSVEYESKQSGIYPDSSGATVNIMNHSVITVAGAWGVSTNANDKDTDITINIEDSTIKATSNVGTAVMLNVDGELNIRNSDLEGEAQAVIVRCGDADISGSTLVSRGQTSQSTYNAPYEEATDWGSGNFVPYATLVVGNKSTVQQYAVNVTCKVENSKITMQNLGGNLSATEVYAAADNNCTVEFISSDYAQKVKDDDAYFVRSGSTLNLRTSETSEPINLNS